MFLSITIKEATEKVLIGVLTIVAAQLTLTGIQKAAEKVKVHYPKVKAAMKRRTFKIVTAS
jgi:hypothetical protein